jgi:pyruvate,water dikinase
MLARLARGAQQLFGSPQDIEWAIDTDGTLWLLQSRPITTLAPPAKGPVLGAGPVAETFPDPLTQLEQDLWVAPLRAGLEEALVLAGIATRRRMRGRPAVSVVGARVVADLDLLGLRPGRTRWWSKLNPVPPARRLKASWRVGRLRAALPALGRDVVSGTDVLLADVPALRDLPDALLLGILRRSHQALVALHGHEVLLGLLVPTDAGAVTGASVALQALADARAQELTDAETVSAQPVTLALVPPSVAPVTMLPALSGRPPVVHEPDADEAAIVREALRLRARWVQELTARAAWELGRRLAQRGALQEAADIGLLTLDELTSMVRGGARPDNFDDRHMCMPCAALPSAFRLGPDGEIVPIGPGRSASGGVPAGGGRASGPVHVGDGVPPEGSVLVVRHLQPQLASVLPRLAGLVSETGSPLSHLAILAREMNLPVVVGVPDAVSRFAPGTGLVVDGSTGEVSATEEAS